MSPEPQSTQDGSCFSSPSRGASSGCGGTPEVLKCPVKASPYESSVTLHLSTCFWTSVFHLKNRRLKKCFWVFGGGKGKEGMEDAAFPASGSLNQFSSRVKCLILSQELIFMLLYIYQGPFLHTGSCSGLATDTCKTNCLGLGKELHKTPTALSALVCTLAKYMYPFTLKVGLAIENLSIKGKKAFSKRGKSCFSAEVFHFSIL